MTTLASHFVRMARNNHWSNYRLLGACERLSEQEYFATRPSFFGSIHATLDHILIVDLLYLGRLKGEERVPPDCDVLCPGLDALRERQYSVDRELVDYCEAQDVSSLQAEVTYRRSNNQVYTETVASVLSHLFIHQIHHRGQVHDMLSATSVTPPQLDEYFLRGDSALRETELAALGLPRE